MAPTSCAMFGTDGRDQPDIPALGAHRPHRSATIGSPARGGRLFGALVEPGGEAVTRAGPTGAPVGAPLRRVLLSGGRTMHGIQPNVGDGGGVPPIVFTSCEMLDAAHE